LEDDGIIAQRKEAARGGRPHTTVTLTPAGRRRFVKYLETLEEVLAQAAAAVGASAPSVTLALGRPSRA
jgi:DNA-binding PadR family transcriptional regulator